MKFTIRLFVIVSLLLTSQSFFAQEATISSEKVVTEAKKAAEHQKKINKEQERIKKHQNDLKNAQKSIDKTQKKIDKQKLANQKMANKFASKNNSEEEIQRQKIKSTERELKIYKLELQLLEQQKELDKLRASF